MYTDKQLTELTLTVGENTVTWSTPHNDLTMENLLEAFTGLCVAHTWLPSTVYSSMISFAEERLND